MLMMGKNESNISFRNKKKAIKKSNVFLEAIFATAFTSLKQIAFFLSNTANQALALMTETNESGSGHIFKN